MKLNSVLLFLFFGLISTACGTETSKSPDNSTVEVSKDGAIGKTIEAATPTSEKAVTPTSEPTKNITQIEQTPKEKNYFGIFSYQVSVDPGYQAVCSGTANTDDPKYLKAEIAPTRVLTELESKVLLQEYGCKTTDINETDSKIDITIGCQIPQIPIIQTVTCVTPGSGIHYRNVVITNINKMVYSKPDIKWGHEK